MKRLLLLFVVSMCTLMGAWAQDSLIVGYCNSEAATTTSVTAQGKGWVEGAIFLPSSRVESCIGNSIVSVRVAVVNRINVDSLRVWVRTSLTGENLAEGLITAKGNNKITKGWNIISLDTPYAIKDSTPLYVGFSYRQRGEASVFSIVGEATPNAFFAHLGEQAEWTDLNLKGCLSCEAVVKGDKLPLYDLGVVSAVANPNPNTGNTKMIVNVYNYAVKTITGFTLTTTCQEAGFSDTRHFDKGVAPYSGAEVTYELQLPDDKAVGTSWPVTVTIDGIDDGGDMSVSNNSADAAFSFERKVLIEEFTTSRCSNCPRVAGYLHQVLSDPAYAGKAVAVCHHSGYYTDKFTNDSDLDYEWFFGGYEFAPAMMFDRVEISTGSLLVTPSLQTIQDVVSGRYAEPTYVFLDITPSYINDSTLSVVVSGARTKVFCDTPPRLTLYLLEDSILDKKQAGATGDYYQMHVERWINSTWGDELVWDNGQFEKTYEMKLDTAWVRKNLSLVAFVGGYDSENRLNCEVANAASAVLPAQDLSAISQTSATEDDGKRTKWFTLDGRQLASAPAESGLYICRTIDGKGNSRATKILRK